jgi:hyperosmotically inducible periplasmic protein
MRVWRGRSIQERRETIVPTKKRAMRSITAIPLLSLWVAVSSLLSAQQTPPPSKHVATETKPAESTLAREVRHQLLVLPYYSVFDHITFTLEGDKVTLTGQVLRPTLKRDAEGSVKSIEGMGTVVNHIEVLPVLPTDDELRRAIYHAIFEDAVLQKYAVQALPSIHIIVKNGNAALEGSVDSEADKNLAGAKARGVTNVRDMKDNLVVQPKESGNTGK